MVKVHTLVMTHDVNIRQQTLRAMISSRIDKIHMQVKQLSEVEDSAPQHWVLNRTSEIVEHLDIMHTHDFELSENDMNKLYSSLNYLRAQIDTGDSDET